MLLAIDNKYGWYLPCVSTSMINALVTFNYYQRQSWYGLNFQDIFVQSRLIQDILVWNI
jgi:hypothetical protein